MVKKLIISKEKLNKLFSFLPENKRLSISIFYRKLTRLLRTLPDYIIIGASRSGTTSLYEYLIKHPSVVPAYTKETKFFVRIFSKKSSPTIQSLKKDKSFLQIYNNLRINDYKAYFTFSFIKFLYKHILRRKFITGEATPMYFNHPQVPKRIRCMLPKIKLIILLRNPIDRTHSIYQFRIRQGINLVFNIRPFEEFIKREIEKVKEINIMKNLYRNFILPDGIYENQMKNWLRYFQREQILIIKSEDFFENPQMIMKEVYQFLDLPFFPLNEYKQYNSCLYKKINEETRKWLKNFYEPYNQRLYKLLNKNFDWEK